MKKNVLIAVVALCLIALTAATLSTQNQYEYMIVNVSTNLGGKYKMSSWNKADSVDKKAKYVTRADAMNVLGPTGWEFKQLFYDKLLASNEKMEKWLFMRKKE